jgi:hypothetical protein
VHHALYVVLVMDMYESLTGTFVVRGAEGKVRLLHLPLKKSGERIRGLQNPV